MGNYGIHLNSLCKNTLFAQSVINIGVFHIQYWGFSHFTLFLTTDL